MLRILKLWSRAEVDLLVWLRFRNCWTDNVFIAISNLLYIATVLILHWIIWFVCKAFLVRGPLFTLCAFTHQTLPYFVVRDLRKKIFGALFSSFKSKMCFSIESFKCCSMATPLLETRFISKTDGDKTSHFQLETFLSNCVASNNFK